MTNPAADPSAALEAAYQAVAQRMQGLPVVNPALRVQALEFAPWQGHWLGIVVTPWFMNLTLTPRDTERWVPLAVGAKRRLRFPAGDFEFIGAHDPAFGEFQVCSLFSPMDQFADQAGAVLVAGLSLKALFDPAHAEVPQPAPEAAQAAQDPAVDDRARREFLRGRIGSDRGADGRARD
jgi:[NiFe] hydrogenase assembly HybE family chaperone